MNYLKRHFVNRYFSLDIIEKCVILIRNITERWIEVGTTKDIYKITWLGYNEALNYNSIWGIVEMSDKRWFAFWGVRDGKIMFKRHLNEWDLRFQTQQREAKGFKQIDPSHYEMICPKFHDDFEIWLTTAILSDDF